MSVIEAISQQLFSVFKDCVPPPAQWKKQSKKVDAEDVNRSLGRFYDKARELRKANIPGVLARVKIVLALQQQLLAANYPADMVRQVLFSLILTAFVGKP